MTPPWFVPMNAPRRLDGRGEGEMLVVETIAKIRLDHLVRGVPIKKIARDLRVSKNTVRRCVVQCRAGSSLYELFDTRASNVKHVRCGVFRARTAGWMRPDIVCPGLRGEQNPRSPCNVATVWDHDRKGGRGGPVDPRCRKADEASAGVAQRNGADQRAHPPGVAGPHLPQGQCHHHRQRQADTGFQYGSISEA